MVVDLGVSEEAALFSELDEVLQAGAASFGVLGPGLRAQQQRAFGVAVAARPAGLAQFEELLRLKLELSLELLFLLLGKERRFLRLRLLQRGELLRLGLFARDALTLPLFFSSGLKAQPFLGSPLAPPLQLEGPARPLPLLCSLEPGTLLLLGGLRPRRIHGLAGLLLFLRRLRSGRFLHFLPAKPLFFLGSLGTRELQRLACPQALFLRPQPLGGLGFLRPEPCHGFCARFYVKLLIRHSLSTFMVSNGNLKL